MRLFLVPVDFDWMNDVQLRDRLLENFRARVQESIGTLSGSRLFVKGHQDIQVQDAGNALIVEVKDKDAVAAEKGAPARQRIELEGSTIPIKTPTGTIFRKATRLSMMLGKWREKPVMKTEAVKGAIDNAFAASADVVMETKAQIKGMTPPRVRDILGVR